MSILAYVKADVRSVSVSSGQLITGTLGEAAEAGQPVRLSAADSKYYQSEGDTVDPISAEFDGYLLNSGLAEDKVAIQTGGEIYLGAAAVEGMLYVISPTKGQTEEATSALIAGTNTTLIGYGNSDGNVVISKIETTQTIPS